MVAAVQKLTSEQMQLIPDFLWLAPDRDFPACIQFSGMTRNCSLASGSLT